MNKQKGYSLIEMLVAVAIFSVLGIVMAQTILLSVRTAKRSENTVLIRSEIDQVVNLLEGQLRNANAITACGNNAVTYTDSSGVPNRTFVRYGNGTIHWKGSQLTSGDTEFAPNIFQCSSGSNPETITVNLTVVSSGEGTKEASTITIKTEIKPRYYLE